MTCHMKHVLLDQERAEKECESARASEKPNVAEHVHFSLGVFFVRELDDAEGERKAVLETWVLANSNFHLIKRTLLVLHL